MKSYSEFETVIGLAARWVVNLLASKLGFFAIGPINYVAYAGLSFLLKWIFNKTVVEYNVLVVTSSSEEEFKRLQLAVSKAKNHKFSNLSPEELKELDNEFENSFKDFVKFGNK